MIRELISVAGAAILMGVLVVLPLQTINERINDPTRLINDCKADGGTPQVETVRFNKTVICNGSGYVLWIESTNNKENR